MRAYQIRITDPASNEIFVPGDDGWQRVPYDPVVYSFSSLQPGAGVFTVGGTNRAAPAIALDIGLSYLHEPIVNSYVKVWGVPLRLIEQGGDINGMNVVVLGGMAKGLPLANPVQFGMLASGQISQAFGNWIGTTQSLDMFLQYAGSTPSANQYTGQPPTSDTLPVPLTSDATAANIVFSCQPSASFLDAIVAALKGVFPGYTIKGAISDQVQVIGSPIQGRFPNLVTFATAINQRSIAIVSGYAPDPRRYTGIQITLAGNVITVSDNTSQPTPTQIVFTDLIGQPTWIGPYTVQATCVMRGDIVTGDYVTLPYGPNTLTAAAITQYSSVAQGPFSDNSPKYRSTFYGTYQVMRVRHVGESRNPDGLAWVTVLDLAVLPTNSSLQTTQVDSMPVLYNPTPNAYNFYLPQ